MTSLLQKFQKTSIALALAASVCVPVQAKVIGQNTPANPLTPEYVKATLPKAQQAAWLAYIDHSKKTLAMVEAAWDAEFKASGLDKPVIPKQGFSTRSMPMDKDAAWYGSADALKVADTIVSFQVPDGGWSKNISMGLPPRTPGEFYAAPNLAPVPQTATDFDLEKNKDRANTPEWTWVSTIDNDATNTQLHFLRLVIAALPASQSAKYRKSYLHGIQYLLDAQMPNGGWPQCWPLAGEYHDALTYNDDAMTESMESLQAIVDGETPFVPAAIRQRAKIAVAKGMAIILKTQIVVDGRKTVWCQQHDELTLAPVSARNYEMPSEASGESSTLLIYLMGLPHPTPAVKSAIESGVAWFQKTAIHDMIWTGDRTTGRHLEKSPGSTIWPRYSQIGTDLPIFGDRDKSIHDDVMEISNERRNGYAWYNGDGNETLAKYADWSAARTAKSSLRPQK
jgi:PelA/Pel-15E family pectate lyase